MAMTATLRRVSAAELHRLRASPAELGALLGEGGEGLPVEEVKPRGLLGLLWRFVPITISQVSGSAPASRALAEPNAHQLDLDKAWHGLHFLFTGTAWEGTEPANFLLSGGIDLGDDESWGPVRGLEPEVVRRIAAFLAARYLVRGWVERKLAGRPRFAAIERAVAEEGWKTVALLRPNPPPAPPDLTRLSVLRI